MSRALPEPGDVLEGKVEIVRLLGRGGMGAVYEGHHRRTGRRVAVKVMRAELGAEAAECARFLQEALACGRVRHPNVIDVLDASTADGQPYLVMELLDGESLAARIARSGPLDPAEAVDLVGQALAGVAAAHAAGIVHRDLKPDNVFLARVPPSGATVAKVLDFGISKLAGTADSLDATALSLTRTGMVLGTPYYMSPEQARGLKDIDGRSDVYAGGAMLFHALTGRPPFLADGYNALIAQILLDEPPLLRALRPELPPSLEGIVARAMAKKREERFATMDELVDRLARHTRLLPDATILMTDLDGFLAYATSTPLEAVEELLEEWEQKHREVAQRHGGVLRLVVGDEMLCTFATVPAAIAAWSELVRPETWSERSRPHVRFRAAVNRGDLRLVRAAMYGEAINTCARMTAVGPVGRLAMKRSLAATLDVASEPVTPPPTPPASHTSAVSDMVSVAAV